MRLIQVCLILFLFCPFLTQAQLAEKDIEKIRAYEDSMIVDAFLVVNDTVPERRFLATRNLILHLKEALRPDYSYEYSFDRLKAVSIQYAPDKSFRIFTWQLPVSKTEYRYFGAIQLNTREVQLIPLSDRSNEVEDPYMAILGPRNWYGALYYNILKVKQEQTEYYLLFGYDAYNTLSKRKLVEVMHFQNGSPVFGAPLIPDRSSGRMLNRLVLEYHGQSSIRLNYDEAMKMLVFDHLIAVPDKRTGREIIVPDGSYEGYKIVKNELVYEKKLFNTVVDEAPREEAVLDAETKDLFGRPKKKN